jgi:hypothetical protein
MRLDDLAFQRAHTAAVQRAAFAPKGSKRANEAALRDLVRKQLKRELRGRRKRA